VRSGEAMCERDTDRLRRSVVAVCDREKNRIWGAVGLYVTERRTECAERWGCV